MSKFLKGFWNYTNFSNNTTLKIVSVVFSIMFWFYVMGDINPELTSAIENVDVELLNTEELAQSGLVMIGQKDYTVNVEIRGRRNDVYMVASEDVKISADVMGFKAGKNSVPLDISVPSSVNLVNFTPKQIKIELDRVVQKQKSVEIIRSNTHIEGFMTESPKAEIEEVLVAGPESLVNDVEKVIGEIDVGGLTESVSQNVPLRAIDEEGNEVAGVSLGQRYTKVYLPVYRFESFEIVPDIIGEVENNYKVVSVSVVPESIQIQGDAKDIELVENIKTEAIDITGLAESFEVDVPVIMSNSLLPSYMSGPVKVNVQIQQLKTKELKISSDSIVIENLENGLATNLPEKDTDIIVRISDLESLIDNVNTSEVNLYVDLQGLGKGIHEVEIFSEENEYAGFEIITPSIEIEISEEPENGDEE